MPSLIVSSDPTLNPVIQPLGPVISRPQSVSSGSTPAVTSVTSPVITSTAAPTATSSSSLNTVIQSVTTDIIDSVSAYSRSAKLSADEASGSLEIIRENVTGVETYAQISQDFASVSGGYSMLSSGQANIATAQASVALSAANTAQEAMLIGPLTAGVWRTCSGLPRLLLNGTGTVTIDTRNKAGEITTAVFSQTISAASNAVYFPYFGSNAVSIRAAFTETAMAEII